MSKIATIPFVSLSSRPASPTASVASSAAPPSPPTLHAPRARMYCAASNLSAASHLSEARLLSSPRPSSARSMRSNSDVTFFEGMELEALRSASGSPLPRTSLSSVPAGSPGARSPRSSPTPPAEVFAPPDVVFEELTRTQRLCAHVTRALGALLGFGVLGTIVFGVARYVAAGEKKG